MVSALKALVMRRWILAPSVGLPFCSSDGFNPLRDEHLFAES